MQRRGHRHHREDRPRRIRKCADADGRDGKGRDQPFGSGCVDDGPARHLADQPDQATDRQDKANFHLRPFLCRQIDRNERTKTGLHIRQKEDEPVKPAQAFPRGSGCRLDLHRFRQRRGQSIVTALPLTASTVGPVNRMSGRTGEQDNSPPSLGTKLQRL